MECCERESISSRATASRRVLPNRAPLGNPILEVRNVEILSLHVRSHRGYRRNPQVVVRQVTSTP